MLSIGIIKSVDYCRNLTRADSDYYPVREHCEGRLGQREAALEPTGEACGILAEAENVSFPKAQALVEEQIRQANVQED